jgi:hypothetical protein
MSDQRDPRDLTEVQDFVLTVINSLKRDAATDSDDLREALLTRGIDRIYLKVKAGDVCAELDLSSAGAPVRSTPTDSPPDPCPPKPVIYLSVWTG